MKGKKITLLLLSLTLFGGTAFGQLFQKIGEYEKIPESDYYWYNYQRCTHNNQLGALEPLNEDLQGAVKYYHGNEVITSIKDGTSTIYSNGNEQEFVTKSAMIYNSSSAKKVSLPYEVSTNTWGYDYGFTGKANKINGMYYFQVKNIRVDEDNVSQGVCYYDGSQSQMEYFYDSYGLYSAIGNGLVFNDMLLVKTNYPEQNTALQYYEKKSSGNGIEIDGTMPIVYGTGNYESLEFIEIISQEQDKLMLFYEDSAEYIVNSFNGEDTENWDNYDWLIMHKEFSISKDYGELAYIDKNVIATLREDTVWSVNSSNSLQVLYAPVELNGELIKPNKVTGIMGNTLYFTRESETQVLYRWDGTTLTALPHYGYSPYFKEFEGEAYFSFAISESFSHLVPSSLYKDMGDTIVPFSGIDPGYVTEINLIREGDYIYALGEYVGGIIGELSITETTRCPGTTDTVSVEVVDGADVQWYKNGEPIEGATETDYIFEYSFIKDTFYVEASTTESTQLSMEIATNPNTHGMPEFYGESDAVHNCSGKDGEIILDAKMAYYEVVCDSMFWYLNGEFIDIDAIGDIYMTKNTLKVKDLDETKVGEYYVELYGGQCQFKTTSDTVTLDTLGLPVVIENTFEDKKGCEGISLDNQIIAKETDSSSIYRIDLFYSSDSANFDNIASTASTEGIHDTLNHSIESFSASNIGLYYANVVGHCGELNTDTVSFTMTKPFVVNSHSEDTSSCPETAQQLKVSTETAEEISFQWYLNNTIIENAVDSIYNIASLDATNSGTYSINIKGICQEITMKVANVELLPATKIIEHPTDLSLNKGDTLELMVKAEGAGDLTYQWKFNGDTLENEVTDSLVIQSVATENAGDYVVNITGTCGSVESETSTVTISTVGIDHHENNSVHLYPNPATNVINIESDNTINTVVIYDVAGKTIKTIDGNNRTDQINISSLDKGIFILQIETSKGVNTYRMVKE